MAGRRIKKFKLLSETIKEDTRPSTGQPDKLSKLPTEILELIISPLTFRDNIRASAVCKRLHVVANAVRKVNKAPWLMLFPKSGDLYEFYDPSQRKIYWLQLPELHGSRLCYSKDGWLLLYKPRNHHVLFYCPYTQENIKLPRRELGSQIVAFSAAPTSPSCILFTVKRVSTTIVTISTCHPGATEWTTADYQNSLSYVCSMVFCNGLFYCLSITGLLGVYNPNESTWDVLSVPPPRCPEGFCFKKWWNGRFMAEHNGDIFVTYICSALNPVAYKLDQTNKVWKLMETLEGSTLFASFLSSQARMDLNGMMRNNVYFPKVLYYGKRCVYYSPDSGRYHPRNQCYDWVAEQEQHESIWIDAPDDLSTFL